MAAGVLPFRPPCAGRTDTAQRIVLVRHGETEWSRDGRHTGRSDVPLTEAGRAAAARLRAPLAGWRAVVIDDLSEWDYGEYDGLTVEEVQRHRPGWLLWRDGPVGGETLAAVASRADRVIARARSADGNALLFSHGHLLRVLAARWLEMAPAAGQRFFLATASPSVLGYEHEWTVIRRWNESTT
ncbi:MAG: histidine phosphatase family protein [Chloroflexi bacterium]|nr:MAG: histidine phosphatase family protein [Chloroflexota bacterium]